jgi:hypothetical protein
VNVSSGAALEVGRLQDQAQLFFAKIQLEKVRTAVQDNPGTGVRALAFMVWSLS